MLKAQTSVPGVSTGRQTMSRKSERETEVPLLALPAPQSGWRALGKELAVGGQGCPVGGGRGRRKKVQAGAL